MSLLVADYSYVSQAEHHHVHCARMATRNWLFSHIRGTYAQNVAVSVLHFLMTLHFARFVTIFLIRSVNKSIVLQSNFYCHNDNYIIIIFILFICYIIYLSSRSLLHFLFTMCVTSSKLFSYSFIKLQSSSFILITFWLFHDFFGWARQSANLKIKKITENCNFCSLL